MRVNVYNKIYVLRTSAMLCRVLRKLLNRTKISLPVKIRRLLRLEDLSLPPPLFSFKPALNGLNRGYYGGTFIIPLFYEHGSDGFAVSDIVSCFLVVQWNPVNTVNNGPKKKIVRMNEGFFFFFMRNVWLLCQVAKKGAVITR